MLLVAVHCVSVLASLPSACLCATDQLLLWVSQEAGCGKLFAGHTEPQVTATRPKHSFFFLVEKSIGEVQENCVVSAISFCLTILNLSPEAHKAGFQWSAIATSSASGHCLFGESF